MKKSNVKFANKKSSATKVTAKPVKKANLSTLNPKDVLNRKQAAEYIGISIYAVDQALLKSKLSSLTVNAVTKFATVNKAK